MVTGVASRWDPAAFSLKMATQGRGVVAGGHRGDLFSSEMVRP
ncbi:hypothetical protein TIFTF001_033304, partial [Ficus carica]